MQTGQNKFGMQTMNQSLLDLYSKRTITYEDALARSSVPDELISMLDRTGINHAQAPRRVGVVK
jgi:twitching motility protein PilT